MERTLDSVQYPQQLCAGYVAQTEGVHQLHGLYALWRNHHIEHFDDDLAQHKRVLAFYEAHYEHCVDIIRQRLMCTTDPAMVTFRWVEGEDTLIEPHFNTMHFCRNFDHLLDWNTANAASVDVGDIKWRAPEDAVKLRSPL